MKLLYLNRFTLSNKNKVSVSILNFGCVVYEINLPDKDGNVVDVNLGFDNVKGNLKHHYLLYFI